MKRVTGSWIILYVMVLVNGQDFRDIFFDGDWTSQIGYKRHNFPRDTFNVLDFGAYKDGIRLSTARLQSAIDACEKAGGGVIYFPPGKYHTGSIFPGSNMDIYLEEGATLLGSMDIKDYPEEQSRFAGTEAAYPMAIISILNAKNVRLSGKGIIHGRGKPFWEKFWKMKSLYEENNLRWAVDYDCKRPRMVLAQNCENIFIGGITLEESAFWTIHILYSKSVTIDGVTIKNNIGGAGPSTDGIDLDSSEDILVEHCDIDCNDDNFCIKAGRDADGLRVNRPCRYIELRNNIARGGYGLVTFGSDPSGGINHVYVHDMKAEGNYRGIRFKSAKTRGGVIDNILIEKIEMRDIEIVLEFNMNWFPDWSYPVLPDGFHRDSIPHYWNAVLLKVEPPERGYTHLSNVYISHMDVRESKQAFMVEGFSEAPVEGLIFDNVIIHAESAGRIKHAKNWKASETIFTFKDGKLPEMENCDGIEYIFTPCLN